MEPREPLEYLKSLLEDVTFAVENEDSVATHNPSDIVNLKHVIKTLKHQQETIHMYKVVDEFVKDESKKVKHIFPFENTAGYGQLCDKVIAYDNALGEIERAIAGFAEMTGDRRFIESVEKAKRFHLKDNERRKNLMDKNLLQAQKVQILGELTKGLDRLKEAGVGEVMNVEKEGLTQVDVDLSPYPFIEQDAKAYMNDEQYFIVTSENILLYLGNIDKGDQEQTIMKDFNSFPRLTEVTILLGKGEVELVAEKFSDSHYFMIYCGEMFSGMVKAYENGHIDIEEEMKKVLS